MNFKQILPYKLRRALTIGAIAGGTLTACDKDHNEPTIPTKDDPQVIVTPTRDVELFFDQNCKNIEEDTIRKYTNMPDVRCIYMIPENPDWTNIQEDNISKMKPVFEARIIIDSTKVHGKGNFLLKPGKMSTADSIWFVKHGWTINQKQK